MHSLTERVEAGRELAVQRTKDTEPEVSWFVEAARVGYDRTTGEPNSLMVMAHFRSYHRYEMGETLGDYSIEAIAQGLIANIHSALELGMLVADDPPMGKGPYPPNISLAARRDMRLKELYGGNVPPAVLEKRRLREEQEKRDSEKREEERKNMPDGPSGALGRVTTYVYDLGSLRKIPKQSHITAEDAEKGLGGQQ